MTRTEVEFAACWDDNAPRVTLYARRHVGADDAAEIVAETFLHAWRRWDDVPTPALPWLLGTARKVIGNQRRSARRRLALGQRIVLLEGVAVLAEDAAVLAIRRREALEALAALTEDHREALLLVAWDGLTVEEAATALGVRPSAVKTRVHRARRRLIDQRSTATEPLLATNMALEGPR